MLKKLFKRVAPQSLIDLSKTIYAKKQYNDWINAGCPVPPPHIVKRKTVSEYQAKYGYKIFIETGTLAGDMVEAQKRSFEKIYSVELGPELHKNAKNRFRNDKHVEIVLGDSSKMLPIILKKVNEPAIFWLDAHYSGGSTAKGDKNCPIYGEIDAIFANKEIHHVLLIDDARSFVGVGDYPTIEELTAYIKEKNASYEIELKDDIIRFVG
jgi:hypothetical protein